MKFGSRRRFRRIGNQRWCGEQTTVRNPNFESTQKNMDLFKEGWLYQGEERLIISINIGLTHSIVSYVHFFPNSKVYIRVVSRWPGQSAGEGDSRVPNILIYNLTTRKLDRCGAEALDGEHEYLSYPFNLIRLRPDLIMNNGGIPPECAYVDFIKYLVDNTQRYFEAITPNGSTFWSRLRPGIEVIFTIPDSCDSSQQAFIRTVAAMAVLAETPRPGAVLKIITEGEASAYYALAQRPSQLRSSNGGTFALVDAGEALVGITGYRVRSLGPRPEIEEACSREYVQAGALYVDNAAYYMLRSKLATSIFSGEEYLEEMMNSFKTRTRPLFDGSQINNVIDFGGRRDTDRLHGILMGKLTLSRDEVTGLFNHSVACIIKGCQKLLDDHHMKTIFLTGSFGESPYLRSRLKEIFAEQGCDVLYFDEPSRHIASKGAFVWRFERGDSVTPNQQKEPKRSLRPLNPTSTVQSVGRFDEVVERPRGSELQRPQQEKLVLSFDIGTTCSAVSFVHSYPGANPEVRLVTRWPGQPLASGDSKVPTLVAYRDSVSIATGAEAVEFVGQPDYEIAQWFKLHLHPESMTSSAPGATIEIPPLPTGVSLLQVYSTFLRFMYQSTSGFFEETTPGGSNIWQRLEPHATLVFAVPNGWDLVQQNILKQAALMAGIVRSEDDAALRMEFVTESEASVQYILRKSSIIPWLREGSTFAVVDAGGSTVDSTVFKCLAMSPKMILKMVGISKCMQAGGVFVDRSARVMLKEKLKGSDYGDEITVTDMVSEFERKAKRLFNGTSDSNIIQFGSRRDNDRNFGIIQGKITLNRLEVAGIFEDTIRSIVNSCMELLKGQNVKNLILVGGFGESPYLRNRLKADLGPQGVEVTIAEEPLKKAAAEGSSSWYLQQLLGNKVAPFTLGVESTLPFDQNRRDHRERRARAYIADDGSTRIRDAYLALIEKDASLESGAEIILKAKTSFEQQPENLKDFGREIYVFDGELKPNWTRDAKGNLLHNMRHLCTVTADLSPLWPLSNMAEGQPGFKYWLLEYELVISLIGTKMAARIRWKKEGKVALGPIHVIRDF